ncbi:FxsA family protein [Rhodococcus sp. NPDC058505]|uniref:FxsA family protein n=1 Tax=unclassified Rhodococcus (in: high G+C Gram-positive bacteria) TaxID=192944 RepID=UPI00364CD356
MIPALFVLYLVVEVAAVVWIGSAIGVGWTILLFLAIWAVGLWLVRSQFRRVLAQFRDAGQDTAAVGGAVADGALVTAGTVLLVVPGLVTGVLGLLMLMPPTRWALRPLAVLLGGRRLAMATAGGAAGAGMYARTRRTTVVDGVIVEDVVVDHGADTPTRITDPLAIEGEVVLPDPRRHPGTGGRAH